MGAGRVWRSAGDSGPYRLRGFTLIEIMVVIAIMAIVLTMGVPIVYRVFHRPPMAQALVDVIEVCSNARSRAILQGHEVDLLIHPREGRMDISGASSTPRPNPAAAAPDAPVELAPPSPAPKGSGLSATLNLEKLRIEMLDVNLTEYKDADTAYVRFFPDGTCDELTVILHSEKEWKKIAFEITTGLAVVGNVR